MLPQISIITPSYNQGDYIERTIKSVLSQNDVNLEYLIMDGGSNDQTLAILKKYDRKIKWLSRKDHGQGDAINRGLKSAKGEIIAYLNSDDTYQPGALRIVSEYFAKNPQAMWVFGKCRIIDQNDRKIRQLITAYKNFWLGRFDYKTLLILNYISQPAVFWRKQAYEEIGEFNTQEYWELDYDYWLRLGKRYHPGFIDQYLANFRIHKKAKTSIGIRHFLQEVEVAKRYTNNPSLIGLHYLNYLSIILGYSILSKIKK